MPLEPTDDTINFQEINYPVWVKQLFQSLADVKSWIKSFTIWLVKQIRNIFKSVKSHLFYVRFESKEKNSGSKILTALIIIKITILIIETNVSCV